jgi:hypothetical protein
MSATRNRMFFVDADNDPRLCRPLANSKRVHKVAGLKGLIHWSACLIHPVGDQYCDTRPRLFSSKCSRMPCRSTLALKAAWRFRGQRPQPGRAVDWCATEPGPSAACCLSGCEGPAWGGRLLRSSPIGADAAAHRYTYARHSALAPRCSVAGCRDWRGGRCAPRTSPDDNPDRHRSPRCGRVPSTRSAHG